VYIFVFFYKRNVCVYIFIYFFFIKLNCVCVYIYIYLHFFNKRNVCVPSGDSQPMDVCTIHHNNTFLRYSVSLLGYGFYGDVLSDSERKRWMGPSRYDLSGTTKLILKGYCKELSMCVDFGGPCGQKRYCSPVTVAVDCRCEDVPDSSLL